MRAERSLLLAVVFLAACSPYQAREITSPPAEIPLRFASLEADARADANLYVSPWWHDFDEPGLSSLISTAFEGNFTLRAAWARLAQAVELESSIGSSRFPQVSVDGSTSRSRLEDSKFPITDGSTVDRTQYSSSFVVQNGLAYEVDLWGRIASQVQAQRSRIEAGRADVENTALLLSGTITELWFRGKEQHSLLKLLEEQVDVNRTQLELIELRLSFGRGSAVDVLQQRQQLAATESEIPLVKSALTQILHQLAALSGASVEELDTGILEGEIPELPKLPHLIAPLDLLQTRPDLRGLQNRLQASEYDVAAAVAERFPALRLGLSYDFSAAALSDVFSRQLASIVGSSSLPLVDGGRRRAEVRRRKAVVQELEFTYGQSFLDAMIEVENALVEERHQLELAALIDKRVAIAQANLDESKARYLNGLTDYLPVILALQALQNLERRQIVEQRALLLARLRLYRAIGGKWTDSLQQQDQGTALVDALSMEDRML